jgi:uncharacterized protein with GYD domain
MLFVWLVLIADVVRSCKAKMEPLPRGLKPKTAGAILTRSELRHYMGVVVVAKYLLLFSLTGEAIKQFIDKPSDRAAVVGQLAQSVGGSLESYYWMFGQYDGAAIVALPDSHTAAALNLAVISSGAFARFETHELIEASDLTTIAERARGITYQAPGT